MANRQLVGILFFGDAVTDVTATEQKYPLGTIRVEEGNTYRYVKNVDATITMVAGDILYRDGTVTNTMWQVNGDISDVDSAYAVGIAQGVIANGGFGWVLTKGYASIKKKTGTAAHSWRAGDFLVAKQAATDDGRAGRVVIAAATKVSAAELREAFERPIGWARGASTKAAVTGNAYIDLE